MISPSLSHWKMLYIALLLDNVFLRNYTISPCLDLICPRQLHFWTNACPQCSQGNLLSSAWIRICSLKVLFLAYALKQTSHSNCLNPECFAMCFCKLLFPKNLISHSLHLCFFSIKWSFLVCLASARWFPKVLSQAWHGSTTGGSPCFSTIWAIFFQ